MNSTVEIEPVSGACEVVGEGGCGAFQRLKPEKYSSKTKKPAVERAGVSYIGAQRKVGCAITCLRRVILKAPDHVIPVHGSPHKRPTYLPSARGGDVYEVSARRWLKGLNQAPQPAPRRLIKSGTENH